MNIKFFWVVILVVALFGTLVFSKKSSQNQTLETKLALSDMVGKPAPDFTLINQKGQTFTLSELRDKKVVLFFNEGIMCYPACWNQMAALSSDTSLNNDEVVSLSIVADTVSQWGSAFERMPGLNEGNILFDTHKEVSTQYDMLDVASSMHRGSKPGHTYVIIDKEGVIRYTLDDPNMGIQNETLISELAKI